MALKEELEQLKALSKEIVKEFEDADPENPGAVGYTHGILIIASELSPDDPTVINSHTTLLGNPTIVCSGVDNLFTQYPIIPQMIAEHRLGRMMAHFADGPEAPDRPARSAEAKPSIAMVHPGNDTEN